MSEPSGEVTDRVLAALPSPDVALDAATTGLKYNHRQLKDGDVYFLFNEGETPLKFTATLANARAATRAQNWNADTGRIEPIAGVAFKDGSATVPIELAPWATKLVVLSAGSN